jgi:hypothetical protein
LGSIERRKIDEANANIGMLGSAQALRQRERPFGNHDRSIELALLIEFDDLVVELVEIVRSASTRWSDRRNDREPSRNCEPNRQSRHCPTASPVSCVTPPALGACWYYSVLKRAVTQ